MITNFEWLTLTAIILGPISGVIVTRFVDRRRERNERRMEVFRTLMKTRRNPMQQEHVGSLNLVEIEFQKDAKVIAQWKELFTHFATQHTRGNDEKIDAETDSADIRIRNERFGRRLADDRSVLLARLLHEIAKALNFRAEQLDIFEGGYSPQGWADAEDEQTMVRRFFIDLAFGRRSIPVAVIDYVRPTDEAGIESSKSVEHKKKRKR